MTTPTFHVLIATVGRPTLQRMLLSLEDQLCENDCLTIVFDGHTNVPLFDLSRMKCKVFQYCEPVALGYWGHGIRNKYAALLEPRDFVMHADDDNVYVSDAFDSLRKHCLEITTLYVFLVQFSNGSTVGKKMSNAFIDTACGVIPYEYNKNATFQLTYGGDGMFYEELNTKYGKHAVFKNHVIYLIRPL
jgi:hypothetical protein